MATISKENKPVIETFTSMVVNEDDISHKLNAPSEIMAKVLEENQNSLKNNQEEQKTIKHEYTQTSFIKEHIKRTH